MSPIGNEPCVLWQPPLPRKAAGANKSDNFLDARQVFVDTKYITPKYGKTISDKSLLHLPRKAAGANKSDKFLVGLLGAALMVVQAPAA